MDLNHIYGDNLEKQHKLRLFKDGKLKYQVWGGKVAVLEAVKETSSCHVRFSQQFPLLRNSADARWRDVPPYS